MPVLVLSLYDLGRPPVEPAALVGRLRHAGIAASLVDLAVEPWPAAAVLAARRVVLSIPMHTAARLAGAIVPRLRAEHPGVLVAAWGLYAVLAGDRPAIAGVVDAEFGPESTDAVLSWCSARLPRDETRSPLAAAPMFPAIERYSRLQIGGELRLAGAVGASRGCLHRCRHCPVPVGYDGRIHLTPVADVLGAADAQVALGARHLSFTDPDFLNSPSHGRRVLAALHARHPQVTFDITVKVEHVLRHRALWPEIAGAGCLFVVSAFESVDDVVLGLLDKGHTAAEAAAALHVLRAAGIEVRPSFLPFTPWTTYESLTQLMDFVFRHDLVASIDPVQYAIRLLVPRGSLLEHHPAMQPHVGRYEDGLLSYRWTHPDPGIDRLQHELAQLAEDAAVVGASAAETYERIRSAIYLAAGVEDSLVALLPSGSVEGRPRMTEAWFC